MNSSTSSRFSRLPCESLFCRLIRRSLIGRERLEDQQVVYRAGSRPITKRTIADLSPRLGVLNNIPFAIPFEARVNIFRSFIRNDKNTAGSRSSSFHSRTRATVRRGHIAEDGFDKLGDANLKEYIEIIFIDQFGEKE
jgi:ubiquitin-protein ligase E3 C